jgi:beta-lactam-binding protein with PASTA domain
VIFGRSPRKIITRGVIDMATSKILEEDSYLYSGPVAEAIPASPSINQDVPGVAGSVVSLSWTAYIGVGPYFGSYTSFDVYRDGAPLVTGLSSSATTYVDSSGAGSTTYTYEIQGVYTLAGHTPVISNDQTITTGMASIIVPNVVGETLAAATADLTAASLTLGTVTSAPDGSIPAGDIVSQSPAAGAGASAGDPVALIESTGPLTVPNLVGETQTQAGIDILAATLIVGTVTTLPNARVPGTVIDQSPLPGSTTVSGAAVDLTVSEGLLVPDVTGETLIAASVALADFSLGLVSYSYSNTLPSGEVLTQSPAGGTYAAGGSYVYLTLSEGPQPVYVPDLSNLTQAQADAALAAVGLATGAVASLPNAFTPAGEVVSQNPPPFTLVAYGSLVNYLLSTGEQAAPLITATGFDVDVTVISQYMNSPTLLALVHNMAEYLDQSTNFANFYNFIWNVDTAVGFGLDIWGKIVGVSRLLHIPNTELPFGFQDNALIQDVEPFNQAPFNSRGNSATQTYTLTDDAYRVLILCKALSNISATTAPAINQLLRNLFPGRGACYVLDLGGMAMQFTFAFADPLSITEYAILTQSGALPHPAGVAVTIAQVSP